MAEGFFDGHFGNDTLTTDKQLEELNLFFRDRYMINTIFNAVFMVFGVLGNSLVLYVYRAKLRRKKRDERYYIVVLATTDLWHCLFSSSLVFAKNRNPLNFPNDVLCKILLYGTNVFSSLSLLFLLVVCVHRYRKICQPLMPDITLRMKNCGIFLAVLSAVVFNFPKLIFFKRKEINILEANAFICGSDMKMKGAMFFVAGMSKFWIAFSIATVLVLIVLYSLIGRVVYKQMKQNVNKRKESERIRIQFGRLSISDDISSTSPRISEHHSKALYKIADNRVKVYEKKKPDPKTATTRSMSMISTLRNQVQTRRLTVMFILITVVSILSYLPTYIFVHFDSKDPTRWFSVSNVELQLLLFLRSLHTVGYVGNPWIYAFFDSAFKQELAKLLCRGMLLESSSEHSSSRHGS